MIGKSYLLFMVLHFTKKKKTNVRSTFHVRVPHSLVFGCIKSKGGYISHPLKFRSGVCTHPSTVGLNGLPLMNTKGHMHTVHYQKYSRNWHNIIKN